MPFIDFFTKLLWNFIDLIVGIINSFLTQFMPKFEIYIVFAGAFAWAYILKNKWKLDWIFVIIYTLVFFGFMRYLGVGG